MINTLTRSTLASAQFLRFRRFEINVHNIHPLCALRTDAKKSHVSIPYNEVLAQSTKSPSWTRRRRGAMEKRPGDKVASFSASANGVTVIWASPRFRYPHSQTLVIWVSPVALTLTQIAKVISEVTGRVTRSCQLLNIPLYQSSTGQRTFHYRMVHIWNNLSTFKFCLKNKLITDFLNSTLW